MAPRGFGYARAALPGIRWLGHLSIAAVLAQVLRPCWAQDFSDVCAHEYLDNVAADVEIRDGETVYQDIRMNQTHRWYYRNFNVTTMNQPDQYRKVIINLEPCRGTVYLFVRKTRRCYPNPYSCIQLSPDAGPRQAADCTWTHFVSEIDGSRDGTPTFFEIPLSSTKYFISIFAPENAAYTLTVLADIGAFPRPGGSGKVSARQLSDLKVQISWEAPAFVPAGISDVKQYMIYSSMLLEEDNRTNPAVFIRSDKIMNTVCGLQNNTDRPYDVLGPGSCSFGFCNATIDGVITDKRYVFNVVAESSRGHRIAYAGLIMRTDWEVITQAASDKTMQVVGAVSGSVLGMVVIIYFLMLKLYG